MKPECRNCQASGTLCPGYRDLSQVMFRDETVRVKQKARPIGVSAIIAANATKVLPATSQATSACRTSRYTVFLPIVPAVHIADTAADFYFANYTFDNPPLSKTYNEWLTQAYQYDRSDGVLRSIIEAVGLAALANIYHVPRIATISKEKYCRALQIMRSTLQDPVAAREDTIFMTVILLGLYEVRSPDGVRYLC